MSIRNVLMALHTEYPDGFRVYVAGGSAAATAVAHVLEIDPVLARKVTFCGIWLPGVNTTDWAGFHPDARAESIFVHGPYRRSVEEGRFGFMPLQYSQAFRWISETPIAAAFIPVTPPDEAGCVSLSIACDFSPALLSRTDVRLIGLANENLPRLAQGPHIPVSRFADIIEDNRPLIEISEPAWSDELDAIAGHIAGLLSDGDTIEAGIGSPQQIAMKAASQRRDIRIYTGLVTDPVLAAMDSGAIADEPGSIVAGAAVGSRALYERCTDPRFRFEPVSVTHSAARIATIPNFKAINSAIEVDLSGQVNGEFLGDTQVSGTGGLLDFMNGARLSQGGQSFIAMLSTARGGTVSRIVSRLSGPCVTVPRSETGFVVTEFGAVNLRGLSAEARKSALIGIAHPKFRASLSAS